MGELNFRGRAPHKNYWGDEDEIWHNWLRRGRMQKLVAVRLLRASSYMGDDALRMVMLCDWE